VVCHSARRPLALDDALAAAAAAPESPLVLGGGDATRWAHLDAFLSARKAGSPAQPIWIEAPATALTSDALRRLKDGGVHGVRVQIEAFGEKMIRALGVGDGEQVITEAEKLGLETEARVCVRPRTFWIVGPLARRLTPRILWLEMGRQDWGKAPAALPVEEIDQTLSQLDNVRFTTHRAMVTGYLPPCVLPATWRMQPGLWRAVLSERDTPNEALAICGDCAHSKQCGWNDPGALSSPHEKRARPIPPDALQRHVASIAVPEVIVRKRPHPDVICTAPWTTLEIPAHEGFASQCGTDWTVRPLGNIHHNTLTEIWNGTGFQQARRLMGRRSLDDLCRPICTRLYDQVLHEKEFSIQPGSEPFVRNQLLLAEEMAERREVLQGLPRHMTLCPSSYCNYDCLFCEYGRTPRVDMPDRVWEELPLFLPALQSLTFLGGEPFASQRVWEFLRTLDTRRFPDVRIDIFTNGGLMTEKALRKVRASAFGNIYVSLNSGSADVYDAIERGTVGLTDVVANVDALLRLRAESAGWFTVTLSLIVMRENAHTMIPFGQLALERNLPIRLVGLNVKSFEDLNFYKDPEQVREVVRHTEEFIDWARKVGRADYVRQGETARDAVLGVASRTLEGRSLITLGIRTRSGEHGRTYTPLAPVA
jgi:molybdenum cofactor biosynthesis enzyme MoaA